MVALYCSNRNGARVRHVAPHAANSGYRRVSGISVLLQNLGAAFAGTLSRVRQRRDHRRNETRPGGGDAWRRPVDSKLRMAAGLPGNWVGKPGLVACLDEVDATSSHARAFRWRFSSSECYIR